MNGFSLFDDGPDGGSQSNPDVQGVIPGQDREHPLSVTQINSIVKGVVDDLIPDVWLAGEISDLSQPRSGHLYFTLKDDSSAIRAVMWRSSVERLRFKPHDGMSIVGSGKLDVYVPRGSYQIVFRSLQPVGEGAMQAALRRLHTRLAGEGLFDPQRKRPLPRFPRRIAFVTSPSGAAIRDYLEVLRSRWPLVDVLVIPVSVQGETAAGEITAGVRIAQRLSPQPELLVVGRGGGSMEDLWAFNDEAVVRAVAASHIPTISAVGHEIDVTLCDLAADVRGLTPSDAAIRSVPDLAETRSQLQSYSDRLAQSLAQLLQSRSQRLLAIQERPVFARPEEIFARKQQQMDDLSERLERAMAVTVQLKVDRFQALVAKAEAISPLAVLARGYSITRRTDHKVALRSVRELTVGDEIETVFVDGSAVSEVRRVAR